MKRIAKFFAVSAAAVVAFASCQPAEKLFVEEQNTIKMVTDFTATALDTKTAFGEKDGTKYPTLWTENDENVMVYMEYNYPKANEDGSTTDTNAYTNTEAAVTPSSDWKSATFSGEFEVKEGAHDFLYMALSPSTAHVGYSAANNQVTFAIPTSQTPLANSVDEKAQVLYANGGSFAEYQRSLDLAFIHATAYAKITVKNLVVPGDAEVTNYSFASEAAIAGRWRIDADGAVTVNSGSEAITINPVNVTNGVVWVALAPVDLRGKEMTFTVNTTSGPIVKKFKFPETGNAGIFQSGHISPFSINMEGLTPDEPEVYTLVSSADELEVGSSIIIAAAEADFAISTNQQANNRAAVAVTKSLTDENVSQIVDPGQTVEIFTLTKGNVNDSFGFKTHDNKYIFAASKEKNYLKTQDNLDDNASFGISITDGVATVQAKGANTRNTMRYNPNNGNPVFACYGATSTTGTLVSLYQKKAGPVQPSTDPAINLEESAVTISAAGTGADQTYVVGFEEVNFDDSPDVTVRYEVNPEEPWCSVEDWDETLVEFSVAENESTEARVAYIDLSYEGEVLATITVTQEGAPAPVVPITVADIKSAIGENTTEVEFSGDVTNLLVTGVSVLDAKYAYIEDASGAVTVYFTGHGLEKGNLINGEISGKGKVFNGLVEVTSLDITKATVTTGTVTETEVTLANLLDNYDNYIAKRIKLVGLTTEDAVKLEKTNLTFKQGDRSAQFRPLGAIDLTLYANSVFDVVCYPSYFNAPQISIINAEDVTVTDEGDVPTTTYKFKKVSSVTSGKSYLIVANASGALKAATQITSNYGYLNVVDVEEASSVIEQDLLTNAFTITAVDGGYTIVQNNGKYLYQTGTYNSFNVSNNPSEGQVWSISANSDGTFTITNNSVNKYVQYSISHKSYGSYASEQDNSALPMLYELQ